MVVALLNWTVYCDILLPFVKSTTLHEDIVRLILEVALMVSLQIVKVRPPLDDLLKAFPKPDIGI